MPVASDNESVWGAFLAEWPLERLRTMTLAEYTQAGDKNCFVYWLEARLDQYGSIWGGSAFKFGIYSRNDTTHKESDGSRIYDEHYGWYRRFGETRDEAFEAVRKEVVAVAEAARAGHLGDIDESELGPVYRWKIAFYYQDRSQSTLFPGIFMRKALLHACDLPSDEKAIPLSELYRQAAALRQPEESQMIFSRRIWFDWVMATPLRILLSAAAVRKGYIPINLGSAPFPETIRGGADKDDAGESVRFRTDTGWEFDSDIRAFMSSQGRIRADFKKYFNQINAQAGDTIEIRQEEGGYVISHYPKGAVSPVDAPAAIAATDRPASIRESISEYTAMPINRILYGPPGTGKTYRTVNEALRILDPAFLDDHQDDRPALKNRYDDLVSEQRIRFVTFHQSFSYEDFVEGIRASTDDITGSLRYEVEDGVFKQICEAARSRNVAEAGAAISIARRKIWKLSLGDANTEGHIFEECIANGVALIGFGAGADLSGVASREDILTRMRTAGEQVSIGDYAVTALNMFIRVVKKGDLVVVTEGNLKFRAIGEVTGDYVYVDRDGADNYAQGRPVRWLRQYDTARPYAELMENRFSQMTIYELRPGSINLGRLEALLAREEEESREPEARVLIIDEINRGNVSRVFGELITLIEPSKREGCAEALEVTLPYSKERFSVPRNVHLIGTMNTADRSLAGLDVALRRRFEFVEMLPDADVLAGVVVDGVPMDELLSTMNQRIEQLLGRDLMLGHAYFMQLKESPSLELLNNVFRHQVLPLLQEYFFEDRQKIAWVLNDHRKSAELQFVQEEKTAVADLFGDDGELSHERRVWRRVWKINEGAFDKPGAYLAIIKATRDVA